MARDPGLRLASQAAILGGVAGMVGGIVLASWIGSLTVRLIIASVLVIAAAAASPRRLWTLAVSLVASGVIATAATLLAERPDAATLWTGMALAVAGAAAIRAAVVLGPSGGPRWGRDQA